MALTKYQLAEKLRTMNRAGSKAPLQNVKLPTNQSNYRTPSMRVSSPDEGNQPQVNPQSLAAAGGLLGKIGKGAWDAFHRPESLALDKASSTNLGDIGGMMGLLQGSDVDVAANMANHAAGNIANLPQPSMLGNGIPTVAEQFGIANSVGKLDGVAELGNLSTVNDAVANATDAANAATAATDVANASTYSLPGAGTILGAGLNIAQGNYGKAAGQVAGATAGSMFGPLGTMAGGMLGGLVGGWLD